MALRTPRATAEYLSCDGTGAGEGVAADTLYQPASPNRSASGSLVPAVAISGVAASTTTRYEFSDSSLKASDHLSLEVSSDNGVTWTDLANTAGFALTGVYIGAGVSPGVNLSAGAGKVMVAFSNAGRFLSATFGQGAGTWVEVRAISWRWRIRKLSVA